MPFITTIAPEDADGALREIYDAAEARSGYIPNYAKLFSHRPDVYAAWQNLSAAVRKHMRLRRYELVTLAAARQLGCTYCMLAHGDIVVNSGEIDEAQLAAIAEDYRNAKLGDDEVAVMDYVTKVIANASSVTQADVDRMKDFGITDAEILDITLAAAMRSFFSKTLDALAAEPDPAYLASNPDLRGALAVGRPLAETR